MTRSPIRFGNLIVTREHDGIKFSDSNLTKDEEEFVLFDVVKGNPVGRFSRIETRGSKIYFQCLEGSSKSANIVISLANTGDIEDTLMFDDDVTKYLENSNGFEISKPDLKEALNYLKEFEGLAGILFTIFTPVKMIILGEERDNLQVIKSCLSLLPPQIAKYQTFHSYSENLDEELDWIGMPATEESLKQLDGMEFTHTFVSIPKSRASTPFTCDLLEQIANDIKDEQFDDVIAQLDALFSQVEELPEIEDTAILADKIDSSMNDAEFLLRMKEIFKLNKITHPYEWRN